jgi:hypothetical protein
MSKDKITKDNIHKYLNCNSKNDIELTTHNIDLDPSLLRTLQAVIALEQMQRKQQGHALLSIIVSYCPETGLKYSAEIAVEE